MRLLTAFIQTIPFTGAGKEPWPETSNSFQLVSTRLVGRTSETMFGIFVRLTRRIGRGGVIVAQSENETKFLNRRRSNRADNWTTFDLIFPQIYERI